jgi:hypothetical protein
MANILIHPNSGIIEFSTGTAGGGQFNPNFTGGALAARMIYDNYGGLNFTSYVSNPTGLERFSIDGADGRLFSVTDNLSGSIFSVNDIAGLPIIEAFDDNTVIMGAFNRNDFVITGNSVGIGALPNTGTQKLFVSGNFAVSGSSVFSIRPNVNGTGVVLNGEAATPQNLATTGSTLNTRINNLSGYINSTGSNIVFTTGNQTINGLKSFVNSAPSTNVIVSFDGEYGNPLEIVTTDEGLSTSYGSSAYAIGVGSAGFAVKYTSSASDWGQPILVTEGGATVVRPASTITFSQPLLAPNLVYSSGDYNYFTTSITLGNSYINLANSTSAITATLPSIASGRNYIVKNLNTGTLTVTGSNFIDGNVNLKLYKNESAHLLGVRNIGFTGWVSLNTNPGIS